MPDTVDFETVDPSEFTHENRYKFLTSTVVPRPIALVTSLSSDGVLNAAPYSQFIIISSNPAMLGIVIGRHPDSGKDTLRNILETGEYVINITSESMAAEVQECAFPHPAAISEVAVTGLSPLPSHLVKPARIAESPVQFECRLHRTVEFGNTPSTLVVGTVVLAHTRRGLRSGHRVQHALLRPLGRIAGRQYCRTNEVIDA